MKRCHPKGSRDKTETQLSLALRTMDVRTLALIKGKSATLQERHEEGAISDVRHTGQGGVELLVYTA